MACTVTGIVISGTCWQESETAHGETGDRSFRRCAKARGNTRRFISCGDVTRQRSTHTLVSNGHRHPLLTPVGGGARICTQQINLQRRCCERAGTAQGKRRTRCNGEGHANPVTAARATYRGDLVGVHGRAGHLVVVQRLERVYEACVRGNLDDIRRRTECRRRNGLQELVGGVGVRRLHQTHGNQPEKTHTPPCRRRSSPTLRSSDTICSGSTARGSSWLAAVAENSRVPEPWGW